MTIGERYRPHDMNHRQAMSHLREVREKCDGQAEALVDAFNKICKETKPVMRHYFVEKHKTPMSWFAMRLNYTRSVATTSIVGHILGLGDRHVSNILLDNGTGEVVHIDLGIAFDQVCASRLRVCPCPQIGSTGKTSTGPRASAVPHDSGHGRRDGLFWYARRLSTLCRRDAPCSPRAFRHRHDRSRGIQARPPPLLVRPISPPYLSC